MVIHRNAQDDYDAWIIAEAGDQLGYRVVSIVCDDGDWHVFLQGSVTTGIQRRGHLPITDLDEAIEWTRNSL